MKWVYWALALVAVAFCGFALRYRSHPACTVPNGGELIGGTRWQIDDFDGAYHARRVSVALSSGEVPTYDTFINAPEGSPVPWPAFFDGLLTAIVELTIDPAPDGSPDLGGYREGDVEGVLVHVPPFLGSIALLGVVLTVLAAASRDRAPPTVASAEPTANDHGMRSVRRTAAWWALVAGLVYAAHPTAVMYGQFGRVDHHVATAMFIALQLACCVRALVAREPIEVALLAAGTGLMGALGILTWLAHGVVLGVCGLGFALRALSKDEVERARGWQGGAIAFAIAALVTLGPAWSSPWNETQPGSLINLSLGVPRALFAAVVPFVVYGLLGRRTPRRDARAGIATLALVAVVFALPGFVAQVREGLAWADRTNAFMFVIDESQPMWVKTVFGVPGYTGHLGHAWYALPFAALVLLWRPRPERLVVLGTLLVFAFMAYAQRRFANSLAVPMAITIAMGGLEVGRLVAMRLPRRVDWAPQAVLALAVLPLVAMSATIPMRFKPDEMVGSANRWTYILDGLRWMRANTPSPGPWNEPEIEPSYAVLASWSDGHLIEYHARRPTVSTNFGSFVGVDNFKGAPRALLHADPIRFQEDLDALGVDYVVLRPRVLSWFMEEAMVADRSAEDRELRPLVDGKELTVHALRSAYYQLALHQLGVGDRHPLFPMMELVWRSDLVIDRFGEIPSGPKQRILSGPSLSIWRVVR